MTPTAALEVLREVAQHTDTTLPSVAQALLGPALRQPLPASMHQQLNAAVQRHLPNDLPNQPG